MKDTFNQLRELKNFLQSAYLGFDSQLAQTIIIVASVFLAFIESPSRHKFAVLSFSVSIILAAISIFIIRRGTGLTIKKIISTLGVIYEAEFEKDSGKISEETFLNKVNHTSEDKSGLDAISDHRRYFERLILLSSLFCILGIFFSAISDKNLITAYWIFVNNLVKS